MNFTALWRVMRAACLLACTACALASCHTTTTRTASGRKPKSFLERTLSQDPNKVSKYDKMLSSSALGDRGAMKVMGRKSYGTADYKGNTLFSGKLGSYQTKDYAQSRKGSRLESQASQLGSKSSNVAGKDYKTKDSAFSGRKAQGADHVFGGAKDTFKTGEFAQGKKSLEDNKRPYFAAPGELEKTKEAYSEDEVRKLLNRN